QVFREYGFVPAAQRWIVGQSLCADGRSLRSYGIRRDGDPAFLFLLPARDRESQAQGLLRAAGLDDSPGAGGLAVPALHVPEQAHPSPSPSPSPFSIPIPTRVPVFQAGWPCPRCTFRNKPTRPGCEMCGCPRPQGYRVPGGHRPDPAEQRRLQQERHGARQCQQALEAERQRNFRELLRAEQAELVPNPEPLECGICLQGVPAGRGVLLRDCLHSFCRDSGCSGLGVHDPGGPKTPPQCPQTPQLLSPEEHARFLERGLALAERRSRNSFHCRGRDCPGWCFYEDTVNEFPCPVCGALNCLLCKAIHEGQNFRQYQDELQLRALDDAAARQTRDMLQTLVQRGEAMHCPTCRIVVQKKDGCDWIRCTVCQTEICWVTKGPRWGPGGPGDTSGGCRCNVNGQRCHPQCQNCH
ncbi:HOIL1 protein, partial [Climacteris rufus]|nr:HOIL1 protein [Climacteris rufus]